jgi:hypothetical protein
MGIATYGSASTGTFNNLNALISAGRFIIKFDKFESGISKINSNLSSSIAALNKVRTRNSNVRKFAVSHYAVWTSPRHSTITFV